MESEHIRFVQEQLNAQGLKAGAVDGYWGPQTEYAFEQLQDKLAGREPELWRPEDIPDVNPQQWPRQTPQWELERFYGKVGENQIRVQLPYPHRLAWDTDRVINSFSCHEKVHDSLQRVLGQVLDYYGLDEIQRLRLDHWGGCLNVRKMRGGSRYSMHS